MKRFFPFILAASLAVTSCSKSGPGEPEKQIEEPKTPEQIQIAKYQQVLPELKDYSKIILNKGSKEGEIIVGGLSNEKYIFAKFSSDNKLITKFSKVLPEELKGKFKYVNTVMAGENNELYYVALSKTDFPTTPEYLRIINVVDDKLIEIGNNISGIEKLALLQKSYNFISFISDEKFLIYDFSGELLTSISSYADEIVSSKYVIINKNQLIRYSIGSDSKIYLKNLNIHAPFGNKTINWEKKYTLLSWERKSGETADFEVKLSDDKDNVIANFTANGKKYDSKGDLQKFTEAGTIKIRKVDGELVK